MNIIFLKNITFIVFSQKMVPRVISSLCVCEVHKHNFSEKHLDIVNIFLRNIMSISFPEKPVSRVIVNIST